jgi:hypothetical protein
MLPAMRRRAGRFAGANFGVYSWHSEPSIEIPPGIETRRAEEATYD